MFPWPAETSQPHWRAWAEVPLGIEWDIQGIQWDRTRYYITNNSWCSALAENGEWAPSSIYIYIFSPPTCGPLCIYIYIWIERKMTMHHEIIGYPIRQIHLNWPWTPWEESSERDRVPLNPLVDQTYPLGSPKSMIWHDINCLINPILFTGWSSCHIISIIFHHLPIQITITWQAKNWSEGMCCAMGRGRLRRWRNASSDTNLFDYEMIDVWKWGIKSNSKWQFQ